MADIRKWFASRYNASQEQVNSILDQIGQVESKNKNITQRGGGPGRGYYQFETHSKISGGLGSGAFQTALTRATSFYKKRGQVPNWITKAKVHDDAMNLTKDQQDSLLLIDLAYKTVRGKSGFGDKLIKDALESGNASKLWVHAHWAGPEKDVDKKLKQFERNVKIGMSIAGDNLVDESKKKDSDQERAESGVFKAEEEANEGIDESARELDKIYLAQMEAQRRR